MPCALELHFMKLKIGATIFILNLDKVSLKKGMYVFVGISCVLNKP